MSPIETDDVTLAVVVSKLEGITLQISDLSVKMDDRPTWQDVRRIERSWEERVSSAVKEREIVTRNQDRRINDLAAWQTWAGRLVMGTVGTAVIGAVFIFRP